MHKMKRGFRDVRISESFNYNWGLSRAFPKEVFEPFSVTVADWTQVCIDPSARASNEYSKNLNFEYESVNPFILEFQYEAGTYEQNEQNGKKQKNLHLQ